MTAITVCQLPNGFTLYREDNEVGGHKYYSDEVGGGVHVWDTSLVGSDTLLAAMVEEARFVKQEYEQKRKEKPHGSLIYTINKGG